ncbi:unnamed protein product, partial [Ectocarpus sp. 12 AP-2014]
AAAAAAVDLGELSEQRSEGRLHAMARLLLRRRPCRWRGRRYYRCHWAVAPPDLRLLSPSAAYGRRVGGAAIAAPATPELRPERFEVPQRLDDDVQEAVVLPGGVNEPPGHRCGGRRDVLLRRL